MFSGLSLPSPVCLYLDSMLPAVTSSSPDFTRIPANSKSRFSLETYHCQKEQQQFCSELLSITGLSRDLLAKIPEHEPNNGVSYQAPAAQLTSISQSRELLAADLYQGTVCDADIFTVEDKDPSVLWK